MYIWEDRYRVDNETYLVVSEEIWDYNRLKELLENNKIYLIGGKYKGKPKYIKSVEEFVYYFRKHLEFEFQICLNKLKEKTRFLNDVILNKENKKEVKE